MNALQNRSQEIAAIVDEVIEKAISHDIIVNPDLFKRRLKVKIGNYRGAAGGSAGHRRPTMQIPTTARYTDPAAWARDLQAKASYTTRDRTWGSASRLAVETGKAVFVEYARIHKDPEIGNFVTTEGRLLAMGTVAHELAHALVYWNRGEEGLSIHTVKPHGPEWQDLYRRLRRVTVNPELPVPTMQVKKSRKPAPVSKRPKLGTTTGRVWELADNNPGLSRKEFIELAISVGFQAGTASTQFSKWRKANG